MCRATRSVRDTWRDQYHGWVEYRDRPPTNGSPAWYPSWRATGAALLAVSTHRAVAEDLYTAAAQDVLAVPLAGWRDAVWWPAALPPTGRGARPRTVGARACPARRPARYPWAVPKGSSWGADQVLGVSNGPSAGTAGALGVGGTWSQLP